MASQQKGVIFETYILEEAQQAWNAEHNHTCALNGAVDEKAVADDGEREGRFNDIVEYTLSDNDDAEDNGETDDEALLEAISRDNDDE